MKLKADQTAQKLRGAYYTPMEISDFLSSFAITSDSRDVLEPCCGDGIFILSAAKQNSNVEIVGIELVESEAQKANSRVKFSKTTAKIYAGNYFDIIQNPQLDSKRFDAVLGNPPYIRYQFIDRNIQDQAEEVFERAGLRFTKHTNLWVPFVVDSLERLKPGGRLAMVIPRELLNVIHPGQLRKHLLQTCSKILIIDPRELLFDDALQGTILLMASKKISDSEESKIGIMHAQDKTFLKLSATKIYNDFEYENCLPAESKWMSSLLSSSERTCFERASKLDVVHKLGELAQIEVGMVTGANEFFLINRSTANSFKIQKYVRPMIGRSQHLSGIVYGEFEHLNNVEDDLPVFFVDFPNLPFEKLSKSLKAYVENGEDRNLHTRYKTRIREPWYVVPSKWEPELFLLKRSNYFPRLVVNEIAALNTDTAYRITSLGIKARKLAWCFVNSLTVISAELEGRSYGGGVLELVPSEIRRLVVPIVDCSESDIDSLNSKFLAGVPYEEILESQDRKILPKLGLSKKEISTIQKARLKLQQRRFRSTVFGVGGVRV